jgi:hypothetical protein
MGIGRVAGSVQVGVGSSFPYATTVGLFGHFYNESGVLADPTAVTLQIKSPDGTENSVSATRRSTGIYYYEQLVSNANTWSFRWTGSGVVDTAGEFSFAVDGTKFTGASGATLLPTSGDNQKIVYMLNGALAAAGAVLVAGSGEALSFGSGPASAGLVRLSESRGGVQFKRLIGPTNVVGLELENDILYIGGAGAGPSLNSLNVDILFGATGTSMWAVSNVNGDKLTAYDKYVEIPVGKLRFPNAGTVQFRDTTATKELQTLKADGSNVLNIGGQSGWAGVNYDMPSGTLHTWRVAGVTEAVLDSRQLDLQNNALLTTGPIHCASGTFQPILTGAVSSTALLSSPPTGLYRISAYTSVTKSSNTGQLAANLSWVDATGPQTKAIIPALDLSASGAATSGYLTVAVASGPVNWSTTFNGASGIPNYRIEWASERIG